jgi:tetratricopeptide (TPR) repeat protein
MYRISGVLLALMIITATSAEIPDPPLSETRLTIHTLLREDIFAGLLENDMQRLTRGEKNIQLLLQHRPEAKAPLLGWQASTVLYRATRAHESGRVDEYRERFQRSLALFEEANRLDSESVGVGVAAVTGGALAILADRLPKEDRADAWSRAYKAYQTLWKQQGPAVDKLPLHIRGELLAGLAQSAQRTGRSTEAAQFIEKIQTLLPDTPYASIAQQWKESPESATSTSITCRTCHESGRLAARLAALK